MLRDEQNVIFSDSDLDSRCHSCSSSSDENPEFSDFTRREHVKAAIQHVNSLRSKQNGKDGRNAVNGTSAEAPRTAQTSPSTPENFFNSTQCDLEKTSSINDVIKTMLTAGRSRSQGFSHLKTREANSFDVTGGNSFYNLHITVNFKGKPLLTECKNLSIHLNDVENDYAVNYLKWLEAHATRIVCRDQSIIINGRVRDVIRLDATMKPKNRHQLIQATRKFKENMCDLSIFGTRNDILRQYAWTMLSAGLHAISESIFILDTGSTVTITNNPKILKKINRNSDVQRTIRGLNSESKSQGVGQIGKLQVLYMPEAPINVISVSMLTKLGYTAIFDDDKAQIKDAKGNVFIHATFKNGLWFTSVSENSFVAVPFKSEVAIPAYSSAEMQNAALRLHLILGHIPHRDIKRAVELGRIKVKNKPTRQESRHRNMAWCPACAEGKIRQKRVPKTRLDPPTAPLQSLSADLCFINRTYDGYVAALVVVDDFSDYTWVRLLKNKRSAHVEFFNILRLVAKGRRSFVRVNMPSTKVFDPDSDLLRVRTDGGMEFVSNWAKMFYKNTGVAHLQSVPYEHHQNGKAERMIQHLCMKARCMRIHSGLHENRQGDALRYASYVHNRSPRANNAWITPHERISGIVPDISAMRIFGTPCVVHIPRELQKRRAKTAPRGRPAQFLGICPITGHYIVKYTDRIRNCSTTARSVLFNETIFGVCRIPGRSSKQDDPGDPSKPVNNKPVRPFSPPSSDSSNSDSSDSNDSSINLSSTGLTSEEDTVNTVHTEESAVGETRVEKTRGKKQSEDSDSSLDSLFDDETADSWDEAIAENSRRQRRREKEYILEAKKRRGPLNGSIWPVYYLNDAYFKHLPNLGAVRGVAKSFSPARVHYDMAMVVERVYATPKRTPANRLQWSDGFYSSLSEKSEVPENSDDSDHPVNQMTPNTPSILIDPMFRGHSDSHDISDVDSDSSLDSNNFDSDCQSSKSKVKRGARSPMRHPKELAQSPPTIEQTAEFSDVDDELSPDLRAEAIADDTAYAAKTPYFYETFEGDETFMNNEPFYLNQHAHAFFTVPRGENKEWVTDDISEYGRKIMSEQAYITMQPDNSAPKRYPEAAKSTKWCDSMRKELASLIKLGTFEVVLRSELNMYDKKNNPDGIKPLPSTWVYKVKEGDTHQFLQNKSRLVARGDLQRPFFNFDPGNVYASVASLDEIRPLLVFAAAKHYHVHHMDVDSAYLCSELTDANIYLNEPAGFRKLAKNLIDIPDAPFVLRLKKSLYGLKQAAALWAAHLRATLEAIGFKHSKRRPSIYFRTESDGSVSIVSCYVDDLVLYVKNESVLNELKTALQLRYKMKDLEEINWLLGTAVEYDRENGRIAFSQTAFIENVAKRFGFNVLNPKRTFTPMSEGDDGFKLFTDFDVMKRDFEESKTVNATDYRAIVGCLLYVSRGTRPDVATAVHLAATASQRPTESHWKAAKQILRYLLYTRHFPLQFNTEKDDFNETIVGIVDASYGRRHQDRRARTGIAVKFGSLKTKTAVHTWRSKLQALVSHNTMHAEYMAACAGTVEIHDLRLFLEECGAVQQNSDGDTRYSLIYTDSQNAVDIAKNQFQHHRTKPIANKYHQIREHVKGEYKICIIDHVPGKDNPADLLTKILGRTLFERHRDNLMNITTPYTQYTSDTFRTMWK